MKEGLFFGKRKGQYRIGGGFILEVLCSRDYKINLFPFFLSSR